ncbi:hypothetical protein BTR22_19085 [Alkalihalophilus pseudofirmus]|uniref:hypothetical protein n=1 Tax=Alkalihalophilus pseudofirmus TaxID=79885 RepID=UPI0009512D2C|nr:hypothetical protein BTR22_19085 [Alkalihalophilus pseudofirmus]
MLKIALPEVYYSLNTEKYARSYIRKNYPELIFIRLVERCVLCEKKEQVRTLRKKVTTKKADSQQRLI